MEYIKHLWCFRKQNKNERRKKKCSVVVAFFYIGFFFLYSHPLEYNTSFLFFCHPICQPTLLLLHIGITQMQAYTEHRKVRERERKKKEIPYNQTQTNHHHHHRHPLSTPSIYCSFHLLYILIIHQIIQTNRTQPNVISFFSAAAALSSVYISPKPLFPKTGGYSSRIFFLYNNYNNTYNTLRHPTEKKEKIT